MNKRKKRIQIMAVIWLIGIFFSIVGTGLLVIFSSRPSSISEEELQQYLNTLSGAIEEQSFSWEGEQEIKDEDMSWTWVQVLEINE